MFSQRRLVHPGYFLHRPGGGENKKKKGGIISAKMNALPDPGQTAPESKNHETAAAEMNGVKRDGVLAQSLCPNYFAAQRNEQINFQQMQVEWICIPMTAWPSSFPRCDFHL